MAEQTGADRKSQLVAQLERARSELAGNLRGVRHDVNPGAHLKHAILRHKASWLIGAAITGCIALSGLRGRRKASQEKHAGHFERSPSKHKRTEKAERTGILLAVLSIVGTMIKPAVTAFISKKITGLVEKNTAEPPRRYARH